MVNVKEYTILKYQTINYHKNVNSFKGHCLELKITIA